MELKQIKDMAANILGQLGQFKGQKVLVIGDVGVDEYIWGDVKRISPEAPVPVVDVNREDSRLGLSCNVAANISSLGAEPWLVGVVGDDQGHSNLSELMNKNDISADHLVVDPDRPTTRKVRVLAEQQQVVRVDFEKKQFISKSVEDDVLVRVKALIPKCDIVILQDYSKGTLTDSLCQAVISEAHKNNKAVLVDPHRNTPLNYYNGTDIFKPNKDEALILAKMELDGLHQPNDLLEQAAKLLKASIKAKSLVMTLGKDGMLIYENKQFRKIPTYAKEVFDVTGAGDTVIASMALAQSAGLSLDESCVLANIAAGIVVAQVGCVSCGIDELKAELSKI